MEGMMTTIMMMPVCGLQKQYKFYRSGWDTDPGKEKRLV